MVIGLIFGLLGLNIVGLIFSIFFGLFSIIGIVFVRILVSILGIYSWTRSRKQT